MHLIGSKHCSQRVRQRGEGQSMLGIGGDGRLFIHPKTSGCIQPSNKCSSIFTIRRALPIIQPFVLIGTIRNTSPKKVVVSCLHRPGSSLPSVAIDGLVQEAVSWDSSPLLPIVMDANSKGAGAAQHIMFLRFVDWYSYVVLKIRVQQLLVHRVGMISPDRHPGGL